MHKISGRVDFLLFGHEHRHLNFSNTNLSKKHRIPYIMSSGKSTDVCIEYKVKEEGEAVIDTDNRLNEGLLGRIIEISNRGDCTVDTINFLNT